MKFTQVAIPLLFSLASAAPAPAPAPVPDKTIKARATEICGQWDSVVTGTYTLYQDLWGEAAATSGSQCSTIDSLTGDVIVWSTAWTWVGASSSVKSYANVALTTAGVQLSSISSIPTTWDYSYTGTSIVADVSYDMFTSSTATGSNEFEIMVWLAALGGAGPISSTGSPVSTPTINDIVWNLYSGPNGDTTVYSFVAQSQVTSFSGDLLGFFTYLIASKGFSRSQYITAIGAGTEPFTGSDAVLSVSRYSVAISTGAVVATSATTSATSTSTKASTTATSTSTRATTTSTSTKASKTSTKATTTSTSAVATSTGGKIPIYYQCGGIGWTGSGTCASGLTCKVQNAYYYQCL